MESEIGGVRSRVVLKTVSRMPRTFINQLYAVDMAVAAWVSLGSVSYAACATYLAKDNAEAGRSGFLDDQVAEVSWTFQVQTAAFGAVLLLNVLNLGMRQHLLPFKCNLLLLFINGVAFVTDLLLWQRATTIATTTSGRLFSPLRYVQWCHSTPTMIYMLALMADCTGWKLVVPLLSDVAMVVTGLAACYTAGLAKDAFTFISFATFAIVLAYVYSMFQKALSDDISSEQRSTLRTVLALLLALWSAFPVVWLAAEWHLMSPQAEAVCWGVCDYLAKVVFSSQLWQSNLTGVQLRRDRALEVWEASNRVEAVARLTALLKQRDDLLSTLSHELRTPLAGIVALTDSLCKDVAASLPACGQTLATVRATATCMLNIVTTTLDSFAARRKGGAPGCDGADGAAVCLPGNSDSSAGGCSGGGEMALLGVVDLRPLIETVTSVLRPLAHDGVAVVNDLPADLPLVSADATRLSQVLYNLVGNAMRFTSQGEVRITARLLLPEGYEPPEGGEGDIVSGDGHGQPNGTHPPGLTGRASMSGATGAAAAAAAAAAGTPATGSIWRYRRPRVSVSSSTSAGSTCCAPSAIPPPGSQVVVSVEDTGVGIRQELLDELFMPYRTGPAVGSSDGHPRSRLATCSSSSSACTASAVTSQIGGTGLGLYLVRLALRAQGSDITAESAPGLGSVFRFRLPTAPAHLVHQHHKQLQLQEQEQQREREREQAEQGERRQRQKKQSQQGQQQPQQRQQRLRMDDTAHQTVSGDEPDALMSAEITTAAQSSELAAGTGGMDAAAVPDRSHLTPSSPPGLWTASAHGRIAKLSGCSRGFTGSAGGSGAGEASFLPLQAQSQSQTQSRLYRPIFTAVPHTKQLERLRCSLDEQRQQRLAAGSAGGAGLVGTAAGSGLYSTACGAVDTPRSCQAAVGGGVVELRGSCSCGRDRGLADSGSSLVGQRRVDVAESGLEAVDATAVAGALPAVTAAHVPPQGNGAAAAVAGAAGVPGATQARGVALRQNYRHRNNGTLQVMSVDDDPINQLVAGQMLTSQSWKVVKCMNGPEALTHLKLPVQLATADGGGADARGASGTGGAVTPESALAAAVAAAQPLMPTVLPDCVLLDVMMPGMSGFEVCRRLREHFSPLQLPIIIVSAKGDTAAVEEAFESGADDYMTKPYKRTEMVARIKAQIKIRDSALQAAEAAAAAALPPAPAPPPPVPVTSAHTAPVQFLSPPAARGNAAASCARDLLVPVGALSAAANGRPASVDVLVLPRSGGRRESIADGGAGGGRAEKSRLRHASPESTRCEACESVQVLRSGGAESDGLHSGGLVGLTATAPAAVLMTGGCPPSEEHLEQLRAARGSAHADAGGDAAPSSVRVSGSQWRLGMDAAVGTSEQLQRPLPVAPAAAAAAAVGSGGVGDSLVSLMQEVLSEVRRGRAADCEAAKLQARMAGLQAACNTLAAERDGWRRQARELRALLASGVGGSAAAATAAAAVTAAQGGSRNAGSGGGGGGGGGCPNQATAMAEALAMAHASRSSGDSSLLATAASGLPAGGGAASAGDSCGGGGAGGTGCGTSGNEGAGGEKLGKSSSHHVAAQLEELKREAQRLRLQLSLALSSVGNSSNAPSDQLCPPDVPTGGAASAAGISGRRRSGMLQQNPQLPGVPTPMGPEAATGAGPRRGPSHALNRRTGPGGADSAPSAVTAAAWGTTVIPNPTFAASQEMFLTTQASALSAMSAHGCRSLLEDNTAAQALHIDLLSSCASDVRPNGNVAASVPAKPAPPLPPPPPSPPGGSSTARSSLAAGDGAKESPAPAAIQEGPVGSRPTTASLPMAPTSLPCLAVEGQEAATAAPVAAASLVPRSSLTEDGTIATASTALEEGPPSDRARRPGSSSPIPMPAAGAEIQVVALQPPPAKLLPAAGARAASSASVQPGPRSSRSKGAGSSSGPGSAGSGILRLLCGKGHLQVSSPDRSPP